MIDKEIIKRERKRFRESIQKAREVILKNHLSTTNLKDHDSFQKYTGRLSQVASLTTLVSDKIFNDFPKLFEEKRGRRIWEIYLSGARYLARRTSQGVFVGLLASYFELEDLVAKVDSYLENVVSGSADIYNLMREIDKYSEHYNKARKICAPYEKEDQKFERQCRIYATLKSWLKEDEFQIMQKTFNKGLDQAFKVIIEGPIQLYLVISRDTFFFILKFLTGKNSIDISEERKELDDANDLHSFIHGLVEGSDKTFRNLIVEALKLYYNDLIDELKELRSEFPTDDRKRRFIERFETGEMFKDKI